MKASDRIRRRARLVGRVHGRTVPWALAFLLGCETEGVIAEPELISFERMTEQRRFDPYEANPFFADGRAMRPPPQGTVHRGAMVGDLALTRGIEQGRYIDKVPLQMTHRLLRRGRERFEVFCAACHGIRGDGDTEVGRMMDLVRPPSLIVRAGSHSHSPGEVYRIIREGRGLMPSYEAQLSVEERWAVIGYLEALILSQQVRLAELPAELQREAKEKLP